MLMGTKKEKWKVQELSLVDNPNLQNIVFCVLFT